ncbi:MAG: NAD-dependent epimerase/dehydratase family protein [Nitriliruptoraceae bacterium]
MSRVLVTGGSGYLGALTVDALVAEGAHTVVSLDRRPSDTPNPAATHITADLLEVDLAELLLSREIDTVVHLAAILEPPPGMDEDMLRRVEVGGTERVLAACLAGKVDHLIVTSSGAAYGYTPRNRVRPLVESDPVPGHPRFAYSRHKAEVEALLAEARAARPELGQLVLRPGTILGERTDNRLTRLFTAPVVVGLSDTDVPFVLIHDRDVVEVIVRGVTERTTGVVNLAGDGTVSLRDIAAIEGHRYLALRPWLLTGALRLLHQLRLVPYGPEQVDFLRYRPVLANDRLKELFEGLPRLSSAEVYARFRGARDG